jgi:hypothetical protein
MAVRVTVHFTSAENAQHFSRLNGVRPKKRRRV